MRSTSRAIGTGQTGATYRVAATYSTPQTGLPNSFAVKLSAQDDAVRERVALGYRSEVEFYSRIADRMRIPVPKSFHRTSPRTAPMSFCCSADMAPAVQGDQIAGCTDRRGPAGGGSPCGTARPELVRPGVDGPGRDLDAETR